MNTKEPIAAEIAKVVPELEQENIQNLLETPKNADMGTSPFLPSHWLKSCARLLK